jgi:hypothetical protein
MTIAPSLTRTLPPAPIARRTTHSHSAVLALVLLIVAIRALVFVTGLVSVNTAKPADFNFTYASGSPWIAYDAAWYHRILLDGYPKLGPTGIVAPHIAYFPLLPMTARLLLNWTGPNAALLIVSNTCALIALLLLYFWARTIVEPPIAFLCVLLVSTYPAAAFFCAGYTEGPFLMLCCLSLWLLAKDRPLEAAGACGLASLLRPTAIGLIAVIVIWAMIHRPTLSLNRRLVRAALLGLLAAIGALAYEGYCWGRYDRWDAYFQAQNHWGEQLDVKGVLGVPANDPASYERLTSFKLYTEPSAAVIKARQAALLAPAPAPLSQKLMEKIRSVPAKILNPAAWNYALAAAICLILVIALIFPGPLPRVLLALPIVIFVVTVVPEHALRFSSIARYELVAPPLFLIVAYWMWRWMPRSLIGVIVTLFLLAQVYYAYRFSRGLWVG